MLETLIVIHLLIVATVAEQQRDGGGIVAAPGDPQCMSHQPAQRRYWRWYCVLVVLVMLVAVQVVLAARHYQQGVEGQCAVRFEGDKPDLAGYHWSWWWLPGWVCEFDRDGRRWERRLW
jgi:hypothetical protein